MCIFKHFKNVRKRNVIDYLYLQKIKILLYKFIKEMLKIYLFKTKNVLKQN